MKKSFLLVAMSALLFTSCNNSGGNNSHKKEEPTPKTIEVKCVDFGLDNGDVFNNYIVGDLVISASKGEGRNDPAYYNKGEVIRLYPGNTLSFLAGGEISNITFTYYDDNIKDTEVNEGTLTDNVWEGFSKELTFTIVNEGTGYSAIKSFEITYLSEDQEEDNTNLTTFTFENIEDGPFTSMSKGDVTISANKGTGQAAPAGNSNNAELRTYVGNTLTVEGIFISKIRFYVSNKETGEMETTVGSLVGLIWTGEEDSITFNIISGQRRFTKIEVNHLGESGEKTVESVAKDVLEAVFEGETNYNQGIDYEDGIAYIERMSDETTLVPATVDGLARVRKVPYLQYVEEYGIRETLWDDGDPGAFAYCIDEDYATTKICVMIGSYFYDDVVMVQYCIYIDE